MLPHLTFLNSGQPGTPVQVPPPPRFRAPVGEIRDVSLRGDNPFYSSRGHTAAQRAGMRYERHIQIELKQILLHYLPSPMLHFHDDSGFRTCIPDGLHVTHQNDATRFTIFEIKSQHMPEAWWQLRRLYEPVVRALQPKAEVALVEICRTLDAHTPFPEEPELIEDLKTFVSTASDGRFGVFRWRI